MEIKRQTETAKRNQSSVLFRVVDFDVVVKFLLSIHSALPVFKFNVLSGLDGRKLER